MLSLSGEEILLFFFDGLSGVDDGVVCLMMVGAGSMMATLYQQHSYVTATRITRL